MTNTFPINGLQSPASDNARVQILCKTAFHPLSLAASIFPQALGDQLFCELPTPVTDRVVVISENGTRSITVSHPQPLSPEFGDMSQRILQKVISRRPIGFQPDPDKNPQYLVAYVVETLECGHSRHFDFIPEVEPLIAKRRVCSECKSLPLKKPVQSVRPAAQRNEVA